MHIMFYKVIINYVAYSLGKDSAGQLVVDTDETKVENSPAKTKGEIPLTMIDSKFVIIQLFVAYSL